MTDNQVRALIASYLLSVSKKETPEAFKYSVEYADRLLNLSKEYAEAIAAGESPKTMDVQVSHVVNQLAAGLKPDVEKIASDASITSGKSVASALPASAASGQLIIGDVPSYVLDPVTVSGKGAVPCSSDAQGQPPQPAAADRADGKVQGSGDFAPADAAVPEPAKEQPAPVATGSILETFDQAFNKLADRIVAPLVEKSVLDVVNQPPQTQQVQTPAPEAAPAAPKRGRPRKDAALPPSQPAQVSQPKVIVCIKCGGVIELKDGLLKCTQCVYQVDPNQAAPGTDVTRRNPAFAKKSNGQAPVQQDQTPAPVAAQKPVTQPVPTASQPGLAFSPVIQSLGNPQVPLSIKTIVNQIVNYEPPPFNIDRATAGLVEIMQSWTKEVLIKRYEECSGRVWNDKLTDTEMKQTVAQTLLGEIK